MNTEMARKIVLVEDNPDDVELTRLALKKNLIMNEVIVLNDGVRALEYLLCTGDCAARDIHDKPAVVLLDINLPRINGVEVLQRLRNDERTRYLPVVILTSSDQEQDLVNAYKFGCNSYIRKPVKFDDFSEAVRQLGLYWLLLNETIPVK